MFRFDVRAQIKNEFSKFLIRGSLPEIAITDSTVYINSYFQNLIHLDIAANHPIKNIPALKQLLIYLIKNTGKKYSYNNLMNILKKSIDVHTIKKYIQYAEQNQLLFSLDAFTDNPSIKTPKKIYTIDNAYLSYFLPPDKRNKDLFLENLVFLELKKKYTTLNFYNGKAECDFILKNDKTFEAIQVAYESNKTELNGLLEAMEYFELEKALFLTYDQEEELELKGRKISVKPVWKWLLERFPSR